MFIPDPDLDFLPIPDPGSKRLRIPDPGVKKAPDPQHLFQVAQQTEKFENVEGRYTVVFSCQHPLPTS
jgi:hypothetical protein